VGKVERFEDLYAWQKARLLTRNVYRVTKQGAFAQDYGLTRQLQRASVSIMSNVAEGFERGGRAEFHQFLSTAKASCAETRSLLYVALDAEYLDEKTFARLLENADEVARIIGGLRAKVEQQRNEQRTTRRDA
jgi:four helix bundle protein